ncbi:hypothetical protein K8352_07765 [Flavobacteriaceae bacterium F89]|uniref:Uncharacterized protein n=1 Tax=Cerina litoralis TaxID=2874477 RepID=A0AAE3EUR4_9FLAO|nr:hypothetical protein [Cerina litoralis]MCG2460639.1 hypothetical protein [Cerina litoralis]
MKTHTRIIANCLLTAAFVLTSCSVDDGADGLMGPKGNKGEQGIKGDQGEKGDPGADGQDGADGKDGLNGADGQNGVDGKDGLDGADGQNGVDGKDGLDGIDGQDGVDGKDGLDGIDGQDGVDGKDGLDGIDGQDGADGKDATVVASSWISLIEDDFVSSSKSIGYGYTYDTSYATTLLTQEALDQDVILVYLKLNTGQIVQMPYVYNSDDHAAVAYTAILSLNSLGINVTPSYDLDYIGLIEPLEISVRFVIIPATALTAKAYPKDFKKMTYNEVMSYFNLR